MQLFVCFSAQLYIRCLGTLHRSLVQIKMLIKTNKINKH